MKAAKDLAVSVLGTRPVSAAVERVLRGRLRVVAYHGVDDPEAFRRQLDLVVSRYESVCGADVVAAMNGGPPLPERAVWITFDDGHSSVVEHALPLLRERGMSATLFVCPGLVDGWRAALVGRRRVRRRPRMDCRPAADRQVRAGAQGAAR